MEKVKKISLADGKMMKRAIKDSFIKLSPMTEAKNPVMFLVYVSAILTTGLFVLALAGIQDAPAGFICGVAIILWFTVLFANFAEAIAEGRGKAQADALRASKKDVTAHKIPSITKKEQVEDVKSAFLKKGELVIVKAGEQIPSDGEVIEGAASVDESAITGESAPVIREAGGDRSAVTGGTTVLSDWIIVRVTSEAGESFLDKMIAMVEGASRKKTPNEIALEIFLIALTIIFILVTVSLYAYSLFCADQAEIENPTSITSLIALLVCLEMCIRDSCQAPSRHEQLFSNSHDIDQLRRRGIQIYHIARFFCSLGSGIHGNCHIRLCKRRRVIRPISGHCHQMPLSLQFPDHIQLALRRGLRQEIIHACFCCDRRCSHRIVSGDHHSLNPHLSKICKLLLHAGLNNIFQIDDSDYQMVLCDDQGRAPLSRNPFYNIFAFFAEDASPCFHISFDCLCSPFANLHSFCIDAAHEMCIRDRQRDERRDGYPAAGHGKAASKQRCLYEIQHLPVFFDHCRSK